MHPAFVFAWKQVLLLALLLAFVLAAGSARAEKADRDKPMNAEADALRYDDLKQTSVFTGNVVITKGTTLIRGGRVEVSQDAEGFQRATITATPGKLAFYRKKRDGVDEFIEGEAERIDYDSRPDTVRFIGRAVMRRMVSGGAVLADETMGSVIAYDNTTDVFSVDGTASEASRSNNPANPGGRVRAMLAPRNAASAPAAVPANPAVKTPVLRPSSSLGGNSSSPPAPPAAETGKKP